MATPSAPAAPATSNSPPSSGQVSLETPISLRVSVHGVTRKFKLPLGDLNAQVLPAKVSCSICVFSIDFSGRT